MCLGLLSLLPSFLPSQEEGRRKEEEGRRKAEEGRREKGEGRRRNGIPSTHLLGWARGGVVVGVCWEHNERRSQYGLASVRARACCRTGWREMEAEIPDSLGLSSLSTPLSVHVLGLLEGLEGSRKSQVVCTNQVLPCEGPWGLCTNQLREFKKSLAHNRQLTFCSKHK